MKVLDSTTRAYRLNGDMISEASLDAVLNAAYSMLANNDEIVPPFDDWDIEEVIADGDRELIYSTTTETGKELRVAFSFGDKLARIMLLSGEEEHFIGEELLCTIRSARKYTVEDWL
jgi:hypothetical protein